MKGFLLIVVVILASTLVESEEVKEVKAAQGPNDPNTSSLLEWRIRDALKNNNTIMHPRIIGGTVASYDQFPYQVRLTLFGLVLSVVIILGWCGGSIISENWVLTAAHCLRRDLDPLPFIVLAVNIEAGGSSTNQFRQSSFVLITDFIIHPTYNSASRYNDFALIKSGPWNVESDPYVRAITLPPASINLDQYVGKTAVASGFGPTTNTETGFPSTTLRYIILQGILRTVCVQQYGGIQANVPTSAFCAQDPRTVKGSVCSYDMGGPLALEENDGPVLIGVASFTHPTRGCDGTAQGFQMVAREILWIKLITGIL